MAGYVIGYIFTHAPKNNSKYRDKFSFIKIITMPRQTNSKGIVMLHKKLVQ
jgi:hypothetical protein